MAEKVIGAPVKLKCVLGDKRSAETQKRAETRRSDKTKKEFNPSAPEGFSDSANNDIIKAAEEIFGTDAN